MAPRDTFADFSDTNRYDGALARALAVSGESKEFFARGRIETTRDILSRCGAAAHSVLDFGCGIGDSSPLLRDILHATRVTGVDPSASSIAHGRESHAAEANVTLLTSAELEREPALRGSFDVAYANGVFHHIPVAERPAAVLTVLEALKSGGRFFLWENHAGNPGTRFVMARCDFDDDAIPIWPHQARSLLEHAGFVVEQTVHRFLFPRALSFLRPFEDRLLRRLPIGAQYVVVARKR